MAKPYGMPVDELAMPFDVRLELLRLRKRYLDVAISPAGAGRVVGPTRKRVRYAAWLKLSNFIRHIEETCCPKET